MPLPRLSLHWRPHWPRRRIARLALALMAAWLCFALILSAVIFVYGFTDQTRPADVIIVLGAGLQPGGRPGPALTRRSRHAAELYHAGIAPYIMCTGGETSHYPRAEADACREILEAQGVPSGAIVLEDESRSTEENAINGHLIMSQHGWQDAVLISDAYHILRAQWIFSLQGVTTYISPVPASQVDFGFLLFSIGREVLALHWQVAKLVLGLPQTYVSGL